jgi:hypothetical protein
MSVMPLIKKRSIWLVSMAAGQNLLCTELPTVFCTDFGDKVGARLSSSGSAFKVIAQNVSKAAYFDRHFYDILKW